MKGKCSDCGIVFDVRLSEQASYAGGIMISFSCPKGHEFKVAYLPLRAVRIRKQLVDLRAKNTPENARKIRRLLAQYQKLYQGLAHNQPEPSA